MGSGPVLLVFFLRHRSWAAEMRAVEVERYATSAVLQCSVVVVVSVQCCLFHRATATAVYFQYQCWNSIVDHCHVNIFPLLKVLQILDCKLFHFKKIWFVVIYLILFHLQNILYQWNVVNWYLVLDTWQKWTVLFCEYHDQDWSPSHPSPVL